MKPETTTNRAARGCRIVTAAALAAIAVALWDGRGLLPAASAQVPDTARQRLEMVREQQRTNQLLEEILEHLRTKPVRVVDARDKAAPTATTGAKR